MQTNINIKMIDAIKTMLNNVYLQFFGNFLLFVNIKPTKSLGTMGVNANMRGFNLYYHDDFANLLTQEQLIFILIHEVMHLISNHQGRCRALNHNHFIANLAQDGIINTNIKDNSKINIYAKMDKKDAGGGLLYVPPEYTGELIYEDFYDWLIKEFKDKPKCKCGSSCPGGKNQDQNQDQEPGDGQNQEKNEDCNCEGKSPEYKTFKDYFESGFYQFDIHLDDEIPDDLKRKMLEEKLAGMRHRGLVPGDMEAMIEKLNASRKNYLKEIQSNIRYMVGSAKYKTFQKPNRRGIAGIRGKKKESKVINVILDTSGSMSGSFETVLSYIFHNNIILNLIQCDTNVTGFEQLANKNQLNKLIIKGLGGTTLQPAFDFIANNRHLRDYNTLLLTDGQCDDIDNILGTKVLVLTTDIDVKFTNPERVKQYKIEVE